MSQTTSIVIGLLIIVVVGGLVYMQTIDSEVTNDIELGTDAVSESEVDDDEPAIADTGKQISADEIAAHKDRTNCWSSINGSVYDLTSWIPKHPGGEQAILRLCGIDGSSGFNAQHGGAALQLKILAGFKIGTLKK